ncbi:MAG TPA: PD-(D/E)XK nuclease family protein, partial [Ilumatobacteraceae bacterium]|nr:PD-(D/E)XK nuclease family protein [Ilumatobacteraceae bacterium]
TQVLDSERLDGCLPVAVEHRFGMDSADDSLVVDTSVGRVRFRGLIDRIDHFDGRARVTDFKSTNSVNPQAPSKHDPTSGGTKLQLHLYSIVADRDHGVDGGYVSVRYVYIRNHVVTPKPVELDQAAAVAWVDELASRIVHGEFYPGEPHGSWGCRDCSPDGLGLETLGGRAARFAALAAERRAEAQVADEDEDDR